MTYVAYNDFNKGKIDNLFFYIYSQFIILNSKLHMDIFVINNIINNKAI